MCENGCRCVLRFSKLVIPYPNQVFGPFLAAAGLRNAKAGPGKSVFQFQGFAEVIGVALQAYKERQSFLCLEKDEYLRIMQAEMVEDEAARTAGTAAV